MNYNVNIHINRSEKEGKFKLGYTKPVAYFLSVLSGVDRLLIEGAIIYSRTPVRFLPWYSTVKGGGAITLGSARKASITFTENFFSENKKEYKSKAYLNNISAWLRLSSHEVMHLAHAKRYKYLMWYLMVFAYQYLRYGHDLSPLELEADHGSYEYDRFIHYTRHELCIDFIDLVFEGKMNEEKQLSTIDELWKSYQLSKRSN